MKLPILLILGILISACNSPKQRRNEITKITVATGGCFGNCPLTAVSIDSSLVYNYYGGQFAKKKGYYLGHISKKLWDTLNMKMEHIHYKELHYKNHTADDQELEIIVHYGAKVKRVVAEDADLPDSVTKVLYWIANSYKQVKLEPFKDTIKFETRVQYPFISPVKIPPNFRFLPPKNKH